MTAQTKNRKGFWQNLLRRDGRKALGAEAPAVAAEARRLIGLAGTPAEPSRPQR